MAKVTIEDISQRTGLSRGTISRALNDRPDISAQTKARVLEACAALNYVPSHAARSLATGRHYAVAVIISDLQNTFNAALLRGVIRQAEKAHYTTTVVELPAEAEQAAGRLRALGTERLDSIIVAVPLSESLAATLRESAAGRSIASCWPIHGLTCDVLAPDLAESGRLAGLHALSGGGRVVYVDATGDHGSLQRRAGFEQACSERGLSPADLIVSAAGAWNGRPDLDALADRLLHATAIVTSDDTLAIATIVWLGVRGRVAGRDVAVIGQGDDPIGERICPSLTTVDYVGDEIGSRAAEVVLQRAANARQDAPETTYIAPILRRRGTSACLPS